MSIADYFEFYILYIPKAVYGWGILSFLFLFAVAVIWKGVKGGIRLAAAFLLIEYVVLLVFFTIFLYRNTEVSDYRLLPFWSYSAVFQGTQVLAQEILMNIAVFIPIGFLTGTIIKNITWKKLAFVGFSVSLTIELLQLIFKRGYCETDDIINNTLGCLIGFCIFLLLRIIV